MFWCTADFMFGGLPSCRLSCGGHMAADLASCLWVVKLQWNDDFSIIHERLHLPAEHIYSNAGEGPEWRGQGRWYRPKLGACTTCWDHMQRP